MSKKYLLKNSFFNRNDEHILWLNENETHENEMNSFAQQLRSIVGVGAGAGLLSVCMCLCTFTSHCKGILITLIKHIKSMRRMCTRLYISENEIDSWYDVNYINPSEYG